MSEVLTSATLEARAIAEPRPSWLRSGRWLALLVFTLYFGLFLLTLRFAPLSPVASVDEQLNYYQIARSFVRYGFLNSGFLQDLSTSSNAAYHPYVYDHMPPGPEIFIALFFKAFGERLALLRLVFAMLFLLGIVYFFRFARLIFERQGLMGEGYAVLFLSAGLVLHTMDHPAHSLSPFFAFFPIVALDRYYRTGKRSHYTLAIAATLVASFYTVTTVFVSFLIGWAMLSALRLVRIDGRHLATLVAVGASGVLVHLLQAMLFLGPAVFFHELTITISNRAFGVPSADDVTAFYREHHIVLNGLHSVNSSRLIASLNQSFRFPGRAFVVALGLVLLLWRAVESVGVRSVTGTTASGRPAAVGASGWLIRLALAVTGVIVPTFVMFPAYAADYGLGGLNELLLSIVAVAVVVCAVREITARAASASPMRERVGRGLVAIALMASLVAVARTQALNLITIMRTTMAPNPYTELAAIGERLHGRIVMTNAYPITAGFFTQEASFGGCGLAAFGSDGSVDASRCHTAFIRGLTRTSEIRPTHFLLFRGGLYVNFSRCTGDCLDTLRQRVAVHHPVIFETELFTIFALKER